MSEAVVCRLFDCGETLRFKALASWLERLVGLLGTTASAGPVALCGCSSIHTFGMRYGIDVAFVSRTGKVVLSRRGVGPCRLLRSSGAYYAFERPAADAPWFREGSWVSVMRIEEQGQGGLGAHNGGESCFI